LREESKKEETQSGIRTGVNLERALREAELKALITPSSIRAKEKPKGLSKKGKKDCRHWRNQKRAKRGKRGGGHRISGAIKKISPKVAKALGRQGTVGPLAPGGKSEDHTKNRNKRRGNIPMKTKGETASLLCSRQTSKKTGSGSGQSSE